MSVISEMTMRRLTISKYMYLQGLFYSDKKSYTNAIQAIINLDFAVETALKAALLFKDVQLNSKKGYPDFPILISGIKTYVKNETLLKEIESLHKMRNDVQHDTRIPSDDDVSRYSFLPRYLLDEICATVFDSKITFESISLTSIVNSAIEKIIITELDKALEIKCFDLCVYFANYLIDYHKKLFRKKMQVPYISPFNNPTFLRMSGGIPLGRSSGLESYERVFGKLFEYVKNHDEVIKWLVSRSILSEYSDEIDALDEKVRYASLEHTSFIEDDAIAARKLAFQIITESQWQLNKVRDLEIPQIFYCRIISQENQPFLQIGVASIAPILSSILNAANKNDKRDFEIKLNNGYQEISLSSEIMKYNFKQIEIRSTHGVARRDVTEWNEAPYFRL